MTEQESVVCTKPERPSIFTRWSGSSGSEHGECPNCEMPVIKMPGHAEWEHVYGWIREAK